MDPDASQTREAFASLRRIITHYEKTGVGRFVKFGVVGGSGVFVNMGVFALCHYALLTTLSDTIRFYVSVCLGIVVSIFTNFVLNDLWTWSDRPKKGMGHWFRRMLLYYFFASIAGAAQFLVASTMHKWVFDLHELIADGVGIIAGILINFPFNNKWTFAKSKPEEDHAEGGKQASI